MHSAPLVRLMAFASLVLVPLACANVDTDAGAPGAEKKEAELLGAPGAFYKTAPSYAFCGTGDFTSCAPDYSFNSRGKLPALVRIAAGSYRVTFENQPAGGNPQVTTAGSARCGTSKPSSTGTGVTIFVSCSGTSGDPRASLVDTPFILSYYQDTNIGGPFGGYAQIEPSAVNPVASAWNSSGGKTSVTNPSQGVFTVTFAGQVAGGDSAQVSVNGTGFAYCTLGPGGWQGGNIDVRCFGPDGKPATPSGFFVWYGKNLRGEPRNSLATGTQGATMVVTAPGIVDASRSQNTCLMGQNDAVIPPGSKTYIEVYPVTTASQGQVPLMGFVNAMSSTGVYCNFAHFPGREVGGDAAATVNCYTAKGLQTTSTHSSMLMIQDKSGC